MDALDATTRSDVYGAGHLRLGDVRQKEDVDLYGPAMQPTALSESADYAGAGVATAAAPVPKARPGPSRERFADDDELVFAPLAKGRRKAKETR